MNRRRFLQNTLATGALAASGCTRQQPPARSQAQAPSAVMPFELDEKTLDDLRVDLESGKYSVRSIAEKYFVRIDQVDKNGPAVNSVIELNRETMSIAGQLDRERSEGRLRSPIHGLPILLKDNIATGDSMKTSAGSLALAETAAPEDSTVARKLRQAGALLMGKTNLSEWANFRSRRSTSGWSARGGQTHNPYATNRNPCGSSSGSAVAVSANLCAAAIGTETDGSIVCPAGINGIVGMKPTVGLISRFGLIPIADSQDTPGPMTRTVRETAILLGILGGADPRDPRTAAAARHAQADYTRYLDPRGLKGARLGVVRNAMTRNEKANRVFEEALAAMQKEGAVLVDPADIPTLGKFGEAELTVLLYEFKAGLNAYLKWLGPRTPVRNLQELIAFNEKHRDKEMPFFGQDLFLAAEQKGTLQDAAYRRAAQTARRLAGPEGIDAVLRKHRLDALVAPTNGPAWLTDWVNGDFSTGGSSSAAAVAGYPIITVPAGFVMGLPVGISFFGAAWSEPVLLKLAYSFEQVTRARQKPGFLPSLELA